MENDFIPFNRPNISDLETSAVVEALESLWLTTGPRTKKFEESFKGLTGAEDALALNSCTAGLHLGLKALGVGPGSEVITTPLTFSATANVIEHLGGTTVLADIDPETWVLSPEKVSEKITANTKVILPVHFAGQMADIKSLGQLAKSHGLTLLEDCAHCLPNTYEEGIPVGGSGNLCAFSFYANKNMTTGEGGMLTGPKDLVSKVRSLSLHGMDRDAWKRFEKGGRWQYDIQQPGFKYNMTDMQAALGLTQLPRVMEFYQARRERALRYIDVFQSQSQIEMPKMADTSSFHIFPIVLKTDELTITRNEFIEKMTAANIGTSVHYQPIHFFTYYKQKYGWQKQDFPVASRIGDNCLTLPLYPSLSFQDQDRIIDNMLKILKSTQRFV